MGNKYVAITGGIGAGKSYVCDQLRQKGIPVYDSDAAAKRLMSTDPTLRAQLIALIGEDVYEGNVLQKRVMSDFLLSSEQNKQSVNAIVHPAVARDFLASGYKYLESAILFESDFHLRIHFDKIVCVIAPLELRIERIMRRDNISREQAESWIQAQMPQEEMITRSDIIITNDKHGCRPCLADNAWL